MTQGNGNDLLVRPASLPAGESGTLISISPAQAGWETISFSVHRLAAGETHHGNTGGEEAVFVLLSGKLSVEWGDGARFLGPRKDVFSGYPHAVYLPCGTGYSIHAESTAEFADARVASRAALRPRVISPDGITSETRGGGNVTRQILDIIKPADEADKLLVCEVYTPSGNWSSYPPHKHDVHNPPAEVDLDEIYYFRIDHPDGYAFQRVYNSTGTLDVTVTARDGDVVLVREGYHPVVAAPGYRVYYLNILAGSARSMASSDDPRYAHIRRNWPPPDPRVPVVNRD
jgi:5-deoxy-glucuronate isomerase